MRDGAKRCVIELHWLVTSGVSRRNCAWGIMGYGSTAEAKIWRRSLGRDVAYEGGDFFEVAYQKGMGNPYPASKVGWNVVDIWLFSGCEVDNVVSTLFQHEVFNKISTLQSWHCFNVVSTSSFQLNFNVEILTLFQRRTTSGFQPDISTLFSGWNDIGLRLEQRFFQVGMTLFQRWNNVGRMLFSGWNDVVSTLIQHWNLVEILMFFQCQDINLKTSSRWHC